MCIKFPRSFSLEEGTEIEKLAGDLVNEKSGYRRVGGRHFLKLSTPHHFRKSYQRTLISLLDLATVISCLTKPHSRTYLHLGSWEWVRDVERREWSVKLGCRIPLKHVKLYYLWPERNSVNPVRKISKKCVRKLIIHSFCRNLGGGRKFEQEAHNERKEIVTYRLMAPIADVL